MSKGVLVKLVGIETTVYEQNMQNSKVVACNRDMIKATWTVGTNSRLGNFD